MKVFATLICLAVTSSCTSRMPGQKWPWTTQSYAEDNTVYHGVGVSF